MVSAFGHDRYSSTSPVRVSSLDQAIACRVHSAAAPSRGRSVLAAVPCKQNHGGVGSLDPFFEAAVVDVSLRHAKQACSSTLAERGAGLTVHECF